MDVEESSSQEFELKLYPNPCKNEISIQYNVESDFKPDIFISDITGNTIKAFSWENQDRQIKINTSHLNNGLYFINVFENGDFIRRRNS